MEHLEALIRGDNMNKQATMVDSETDEVDQDSVLRDSEMEDDYES